MRRFTKNLSGWQLVLPKSGIWLKIWVWSVLLSISTCFYLAPARADRFLDPVSQQPLNSQTVIEDLTQVNVIYLGETHDRPQDHQAQLEIIQQLYASRPKLAIAMEMFQRPYQSVLDHYLTGKTTAPQLREQSQYDQRWGYPWEYYAPILEFARANQLPVLAINTPTEITRKVSRNGLTSLTTEDRRWLPPLTEIRTDNDSYRQMLREIYNSIHHGRTSSRNFDRFFLAQVLWDETMAYTIAQFLRQHPDYQIVVLAGQGHIVYGYGIPDRVARRMQKQGFQQRSLLLNPTLEGRQNFQKKVADYLWQTED